MRVIILPNSYTGKWSIGLIAALAVFFVIFLHPVASGQRGGETFFSNPALTIPIMLAGISGVLAFFTGLIGVIKNRERSIIVFLAMLVSLFILLLSIGEVVFPH
jgi:nitrate reductase gamma subunit